MVFDGSYELYPHDAFHRKKMPPTSGNMGNGFLLDLLALHCPIPVVY